MSDSKPEVTTINGVEFVPKADFDAIEEKLGKAVRTLALSHMHLCFGENEQAVATIIRDTGYTIEDARSIRSLVEWVRAERAARAG